MRPVIAWPGLHLHVRRIRSCLLFGQRKCAELFARTQFWQPSLFLVMRAKEQQRANSNGVMRIHENRCRCAAAADLFQNFAVGHLRETMPAIFLRCSHAKHADPAKSVNHAARNVRFPVHFRWIEMLIQKLTKVTERLVQLGLLCRWDAWIRHDPIRDEMTLEKTLGKTKRLRASKKQFFRLLNFLLSFGVELIHSGCL